MAQIPTVAVLNTSQEVTELLAEVLEDAGMQVVTAFIIEFKRGQRDLQQFVHEHRPRAIVYDLAPPYDQNWQYFMTVREQSGMKACAFVLTTTNRERLEALVGPTDSHELVGKPFDLDEIVDATWRAVRECA